MSNTCPKNITPVSLSECLGNTREKLNANFNSLKDAICSLTDGLSSITDSMKFLPPVGTIIRFWGDIALNGTNFDATGLGKIIAANNQNLSPWALCNGNNGTPDLQDRFIVGAGNLYDQMYPTGNRGPVFNSTASLQFSSVQLTIPEMPQHNHDITDGINNLGHNHPLIIDEHDHNYKDLFMGEKISALHSDIWYIIILPPPLPPVLPLPATLLFGGKQDGVEPINAVGGSGSNSNTVKRLTEPNKSNLAPTTSNNASNVTSQFTGNNMPHENRPPYRALGFIMRIV